MNIEKRRAEIAARKAEIRKLIEGDSENKLNMDDLEKEASASSTRRTRSSKRDRLSSVCSTVARLRPLPLASLIPSLAPQISPRRRAPKSSIAPHGSRPCRVSR